ncbi:MAG: energy-coupling factor transporter ATPase [Clostridia bacterium]|nr:energy-coupling factor transporter ATPase [Clostridia bacterium]MBQ8469452.1 energy-coupling factor transporter ATPase [Clostridia bacterium]
MSETNKEAVIRLRGVSFTYDELPEGISEAEARAEGAPMAVDALDLDIYDGECVAVLGHNGSGKSTFAKLCNGILVPDYGDILVYGINTREEDRLLELRQKVGMVFQNPDNQIVATVVEEDVAFGPENLGFPPEEIRARVDSALKAVRMYKYRGHEPHKLSGGQKQRVAIAGILAMKPECILFDESTAMLDPKGRRDIMRIIRKMHDEMQKTVVYITHYMEEAALADRVIVMENGKVISDGTPVEVFSDIDRIRAVGLDVPEATELAALLREEGMALPDILTTEDCIEALANTLTVKGA